MLWVRTFILGLGFFAISLVWPLYDSYMPIFYGEFIASGFVVGAIMAIDNVLGLTLQPYFGALSDQTRTRFGRRVPYLLVGAPIAAVFLAAIPYARETGLIALLVATLFMNLAMASFRSPTVALMPDLVPGHLRSQANGIINWMGALGAALAFTVGSQLYKQGVHLPFLAAGGMLVLIALIFLFWIREPRNPQGEGVEETPRGLWEAARSLFGGLVDTQARRMLLAIILWTAAFQGTNTWFTTFGTKHLGLSAADASFNLFFFVGAILLFGIPAGLLGGKLGRRRTMAIGAVIMAVGVAAVWYSGGATWPLRGALLLAGTGWSLIVVQAYPALVQMAPAGQTGAYTGLYYIVSQVGAILAPPIYGQLRDWFGWVALFAASVLLLLAAAYTVSGVRGTEARPQPAAGQVRKSSA